jgi:hypothetical protein
MIKKRFMRDEAGAYISAQVHGCTWACYKVFTKLQKQYKLLNKVDEKH